MPLPNPCYPKSFVLTWGWRLTGSRGAASIATAQTRSAKANLYETGQLKIFLLQKRFSPWGRHYRFPPLCVLGQRGNTRGTVHPRFHSSDYTWGHRHIPPRGPHSRETNTLDQLQPVLLNEINKTVFLTKIDQIKKIQKNIPSLPHTIWVAYETTKN